MAAYAALVSLMHIIDQIQLHPRPPISLDKTHVESLAEKVTFLQEFLEGYSHIGESKEADALESRITDAAYAAEDVIESHTVDQILAGYSTTHGEEISSIEFYQGLQKVIENMDFVKKEVKEIKEKMRVQDQLHRNSSISAGSSRPASTAQNSTMVGFDDVLYEMMDKLTRQQSNLQIIPIVGMGGIGKTTLARNIYQNQVVVQHFDILAWVTISQEYRMREILLKLLHQEGGGNLSQMNEYELGDKLHKRLSGRRYLIIMDDIWDIEVWDQLKFFFPNNNNGSRIMLTTRLSKLASQVADSHDIEMGFLDKDNSWNLFSKTVFGEEGCPLELEEIGKKIVENCSGLPLSIVVIGGLLAKSKHTREYWEYIAENLNSVVNSEDNECCLKILRMSYNQMPVYLKPCFLYMGVFPEDHTIHVSTLIKLWVAEGFLKPINGKSLEVVAEEYLKDLIDRNLILVHELGSTGNIKYCKIHDLLRDLCLREVEKEKFLYVTRQHGLNIPQDIDNQRRIAFHQRIPKEKVFDALQSMSLARSFICEHEGTMLPSNFRLLRTLKLLNRHMFDEVSFALEHIYTLVNLRYLAIRVCINLEFPSSVYLFWNLHTLIVNGIWTVEVAPIEIWKLPQLRHVDIPKLYLPDLPSGQVDRGDDFVLRNLHTLMKVMNFKCGEAVVKRIPNIKKLKIYYDTLEGSSPYCLNNLDRLHKLESFRCYSYPRTKPSGTDFLQNLTFPHSLKKLTFAVGHVLWEDILEKIGSLPLLEVFKLSQGSFRGHEWETVEGQFCSLKFLLLEEFDLKYWKTDSTHFPRLEHLVLKDLYDLKEIPSGIGEIPTLQSIELENCSDSSVISAKKILEEQEELGEVGLQVRVRLMEENEALESLASPNFQVQC